MNAENYRRFLAAIGHRVIASPSGYWSDVARWFYESIPPSRVMTLDQAEIKTLFRQHRVIGLKYPAPQDHVGKPSWIYIREDKDYDLKSLHPKMRNKVRQGLRKCTVRPITFEYLRDHGLPLNRDTLERQGRDDPLFGQPAGWARLCQAGQEVEGAGAWGSFVGDELAAYMITFVTDGYYNILHQMSRLDLLKTHANNALAFVATREMLASPGIKGISYGQASIRELPGLEEYKVRLGYEKRPIRHVVVLHPLLRSILLSRAGYALLGGLNRLFPDHDVLKRLNGTVDIARQSQDAGLSSEGGTENRKGERVMFKRVFDIVVALIGLIPFSPLMLIIAVLIKLDSSGPIFYRAPRVGKGGRPFRMYKFRTMVANAEQIGPAITVDKDPRITRIGARLRDSRLDEIPQLINVLRGEMSMVGPRPEAPYYVEKYSPEQREVLRVKPGMAGPAQIVFRHEEEALSNLETLDDEYMNVILPPKLAIDRAYIERQSLGLDLKILFQTGWALLADRLQAGRRQVTAVSIRAPHTNLP